MISLSIKPGASIRGLAPEIVLAVLAVLPVFEAAGMGEVAITEGTGGTHSPGSLHYIGHAVDIRSRDFPGGSMGPIATTAAKKLREALGSEFDVVQEATHFHIEFQPKNPA